MSKKLKFFAMVLTCILLSINQLWGVDYNLVTNVSQLAAGDIVVISTSDGKTATTVENTNSKNDAYWFGYVASTGSVSGGKLTALGTNTAEYTLSKSGSYWVLTCSSGYVGSVATKKLRYNTGTSTWTIAVNTTNYQATISSTDNTGDIQFANGDRFRTYTSAQTAVYLFKKETGSIKTLHFPSHKSGHSFLPNLSFSLCQCSSCNFFKCLTVALYFHCILYFILFTIYSIRYAYTPTRTKNGNSV